MKKFLSIYRDDLEDFIHSSLTSRPDGIFGFVENYAIKTRVPILSPATGEVLRFITNSLRPGRVLELGTGLGYSILWMLSTGLSISIDSWERNPECISRAGEFIEKFRRHGQEVNFRECHIMDTLRDATLQDYDLIFVDCDKICYPELLRILPFKVKKGAFLLFDNVLWHGRLKKGKFNRPSDLSMQEFWDLVSESYPRRTLFPVGDGLLLLQIMDNEM